MAPVSDGPHNTVHQATKGRRGWPSPRAAVEHMGIDHRRSHLAVPEQRPHRADVLAYLQLVSANTWPQASVVEPLGMAEAVAAGRFGDAGSQHGSAHRLLDQGGIQGVMALLAAFGTFLARAWGSCTLPQPAAPSR